MPTVLPESKNLSPTARSKAAANQEQFLRLQLGDSMRALLPIQQLSEVLKIPADRIAPIPHMPAWVMGVYNWRGHILWMSDLAHLVGLTPWHQTGLNPSTHTVIVVNVRSPQSTSTQMLGLVVQKVTDLEWCSPETIQPPTSAATIPELVPFLRGYWMNSSEEMMAILDGQSIVAAMPGA